MLILGIDPGTATTGFGFIEVTDSKMEVREFGLIETMKESAPEIRLQIIHNQLLDLLTKYKPHQLAMEKVFFATNAKTAIRVGQAQGVIMLSAAQHNLPLFEYSPMTIKKLVAGHGRSDKKVMQQAVRKFLGAKVKSRAHKKTHFDNAADALAVALCHVLYNQQNDLQGR